MKLNAVYQHLLDSRRTGPGFLWLLDPDKVDPRKPDPRWQEAAEVGVTALLIGTSQDGNPNYDCAVASIRKHTWLPLILFPGSAAQVSPHVDAVLFLTLLSGRNPDYLVGEQVKGTPLIRNFGIEPIPTGYLLVDTGTTTSVARQSGTSPLSESDVEAICDHALCAQYMGQALVYLEAGSGALRPIAPQVIEAVRRTVGIPVIVGGGLKTPDACREAACAGADFVVVGTALENDRSADTLRHLVEAVSVSRTPVPV